MSERTKISWCDSTVNFWSGCAKVSPGCANCYAETLRNRNQGTFGKWGRGASRKIHESAFKLAEKLNRTPWVCDHCGFAKALPDDPLCPACLGKGFHRREIFSLSLGDWLDPEVPIEWLARMLETIRQCDQAQWLLLTKRPELWLESIQEARRWSDDGDFKAWIDAWLAGPPPQHIAIGTSVEDQERAEERIPALLRIPAAKRFLSLEPLLGRVDAMRWLVPCVGDGFDKPDWVIVGGESGPKARPCNVDWIRSIKDQCAAAGVPCFVKQLGAVPNLASDGDHGCGLMPMRLRDRKGAEPAEWPEDLRVQQRMDWTQ